MFTSPNVYKLTNYSTLLMVMILQFKL